MDTPKDIFPDIESELKAMADKAKTLIKTSDEYIELFDGCGWYPISLSQCNSHSEMVNWTLHLLEKNWITTDHIELLLLEIYQKFPHLDTRR